MKQKLILSHKDVLEILRRYPNEKSEAIAKYFNVSVSNIYKTASRYGIKKSKEFLKSPESGRIMKGSCLSPETQFKKGHVPCFKGKKLPYKPGHLWEKGRKPYNTAKNGEIRWRVAVGFVIRIEENNWEHLNRYLWKKHHGAIPKGYNVIYADGNKRNCVIENLLCVSNAELAEKNRHTKYPLELRRSIELNNTLKRVIKQKIKQE